MEVSLKHIRHALDWNLQGKQKLQKKTDQDRYGGGILRQRCEHSYFGTSKGDLQERTVLDEWNHCLLCPGK